MADGLNLGRAQRDHGAAFVGIAAQLRAVVVVNVVLEFVDRPSDRRRAGRSNRAKWLAEIFKIGCYDRFMRTLKPHASFQPRRVLSAAGLLFGHARRVKRRRSGLDAVPASGSAATLCRELRASFRR